jgi:hypothetical protein
MLDAIAGRRVFPVRERLQVRNYQNTEETVGWIMELVGGQRKSPQCVAVVLRYFEFFLNVFQGWDAGRLLTRATGKSPSRLRT